MGHIWNFLTDTVLKSKFSFNTRFKISFVFLVELKFPLVGPCCSDPGPNEAQQAFGFKITVLLLRPSKSDKWKRHEPPSIPTACAVWFPRLAAGNPSRHRLARRHFTRGRVLSHATPPSLPRRSTPEEQAGRRRRRLLPLLLSGTSAAAFRPLINDRLLPLPFIASQLSPCVPQQRQLRSNPFSLQDYNLWTWCICLSNIVYHFAARTESIYWETFESLVLKRGIESFYVCYLVVHCTGNMWLISICFVSPSIVGGSGREHCACGISLVALNSRDLDKGKGCPRHLHAPKLCPQLCGGRCFFLSPSCLFLSMQNMRVGEGKLPILMLCR